MRNIDEKNILDLIKKLYKKRTSTGVGITYDPITIVEINLLRSLLKFECKDYHIIKTITSVQDIDSLELPTFIDSLKNITLSESVKDHLIKWTIIIPLDINFKIRQLKINGFTFKIFSFSTLKKTFPVEFYHYFKQQKIETKKIEDKKCKYFIVEANGSSLYRAWKKVEPTFNLMRGLMDFILSYNTWTFFTWPQLRTNIPHPKNVFGISSESRAEYLDFAIQKSSPKKIEVSLKQKSNLIKYLKLFKADPGKKSINELLADIFRLYSQAMDENDLQYCFLRFWQIAERIALSDPNGPSSEIIKKRINFFTNPKPDFDLSPYIDKLSTKRNELVHRGIDDIEETDFNILKSICELAIVWLYVNRTKYKTVHHLEIYFSSKDQSDSRINAAIDILTYIKKQRLK
jgi:hypothetical protein